MYCVKLLSVKLDEREKKAYQNANKNRISEKIGVNVAGTLRIRIKDEGIHFKETALGCAQKESGTRRLGKERKKWRMVEWRKRKVKHIHLS